MKKQSLIENLVGLAFLAGLIYFLGWVLPEWHDRFFEKFGTEISIVVRSVFVFIIR